MLIIPKHLKDELQDKKRDAAEKFVKDKVYTVAQAYYTKFKEIKELWILFAAKPDKFTGKLNMMIRAADKPRKHEIDTPLQGAQLWYTNQQTGEIRPEWILPLGDKRKMGNLDSITEGNPLLKGYFKTASKKIGRDLLTGKKL